MINRSFLSLLLVLFSCFINQLAMANNNEPLNNIWQVSLLEGLTQFKSVEDVAKGNDWKDLNLGEKIPGQSYLRTGADSRIILKHRNDILTIASSSLLRLDDETHTETGILTNIVQTIGYALFDIEKNTGRKVVIETPYLVSTVKGTTFSVNINQEGATVNLIEGQLQVDAVSSDDSVIINQGQVAHLKKGDKKISVYSARNTINQQATNTSLKVNSATQAVTNNTSLLKGTSSTSVTDSVNSSITSVNSITGLTGVSGIVGIPAVSAITGTPLAPIAPITADVNGTPIVTDISGVPIVPDTSALPSLPSLP